MRWELALLFSLLCVAGWVPATDGFPPSDELLELLQQLDHQDLMTRWGRARSELAGEAEPSSERLDEIFYEFAGSARTWTQTELLPTWAISTRDGHSRQANQALTTARRIGQALAERGLDDLVKDSIDRIDQAIDAGNVEEIAALSEGHRLYAEAVAQRNGGPLTVREALKVARAALASAQSPFVFWVDYQLALSEYYDDAPATEAAVSEILQRVANLPYWPLRGWCHWIRGLARFKQGAYTSTLADYGRTYELLVQARDNSAATALGLQADVYQALGHSDTAWDLRLQAIRELATQGNRSQLHNYLHAVVLALLNMEQFQDAATWGVHLVANAEALGWPGQQAEATLLNGKILAALGRHAEAQEMFAASRAHARRLLPDDLRAQLEADVAAASGSLLVATDPQAAVEELSAALKVRDAAGYIWQRPRLLRDRARAHGNLGDTQLQRRDLVRALRDIDEVRKEPDQERFRISYWETVQDLLDDMLRFQALTARDAKRAWFYAERTRGRALLDRLQAGREDEDFEQEALEEGFPEVEIRRIQRLLPKDALLVEAAVLDEHLILWLLDRKDVEMHVLGVGASEVSRRVEEIRTQIDRRAEVAAFQESTAEMFDLMFGSFDNRLRKAEDLIIVPDRTLHRLPWAALFDRKEKKYLFEDRDLTVLPSASILTLGQDREPFGTIEEGPVLVVGDPAINRDVFDLERLPSAAEEGKGVAGLYTRSTHLSDTGATRSQFLEALAQTRVLHVAGHVQVNERDPLQSSIPLAPESEDDLGLLHAREIYDLPLSNVELVVLSACRSVDGFPSGAREGVAGLARAFLAAGAGAVVASLWDVYDEPSQVLMTTFHEHFRDGVPPAEALRRAQMSLLHSGDPELSHPASWAGFEALGWAF